MIFTDSHTHLHFPEFGEDLRSTLERARERGVRYFVNVGTNLECSKRAVQLAQDHDGVFASIGCHPHDAKDWREPDDAQFAELAHHPKVVAIGEVGLDFYRNLSPPQTQREIFRKFLRLHLQSGLPLILHVRNAHAETFDLLRETVGSTVRGVLHCFSGDHEVLERALSFGLWISFACNITYRKNEDLRRLVALVPKEKILLETDSPFLPPEGFRGKRNEPGYILEAARLVAEIMGLPFAELGALTTRNASQLFGFCTGAKDSMA